MAAHSMHRDAAHAWVENENSGSMMGGRTSRLVAVETPDLGGCVTFDPDTGDAVVWSVGYSTRKVNGCYRRLSPKRVRQMTLPGDNWRERRDAAKQVRVEG